MSENRTRFDYEVGYGKPPKDTQFRKGVSGNPKGRPKKALGFDHELLREAESFITITENGQRKRVSKIEAIAKQVTNKALIGNIRDARTYVGFYQQALEKVAAAEPQPSDSWKNKPLREMTEEELRWLAARALKEVE